MATKLDKKFSDGIKEGVQALIYEVERLEMQVSNVEGALDSEAVESFIKNLGWSDGTPDIHVTLVAGNIRNFAGAILRKLHSAKVETV